MATQQNGRILFQIIVHCSPPKLESISGREYHQYFEKISKKHAQQHCLTSHIVLPPSLFDFAQSSFGRARVAEKFREQEQQLAAATQRLQLAQRQFAGPSSALCRMVEGGSSHGTVM